MCVQQHRRDVGNTIYLLSGAQASGKSSYGRHLANNDYTHYVSRDAIRFSKLSDGEPYFCHENEVVEEFYRVINYWLDNWYDVVIDQTSTMIKSIQKVIYNISRDLDGSGLICPYNIVLVRMETPLETCLARNAMRTGRERVPDKVVRRTYEEMDSIEDIKKAIPEIRHIWKVDGTNGIKY